MKRSKKAATVSQRSRWDLLRDYGCICCRKKGLIRHPEIHHLLSGGRRMGHDHTIPLCPWHHRGEPMTIDSTKKTTEAWLGPSLAESLIRFNHIFGSETELLLEVNKWLARSAARADGRKGSKEKGSFSTF